MWILDKLYNIKNRLEIGKVYDEEDHTFLDVRRSFFTFMTCPRLELIHFFVVLVSIITLAIVLSVETGDRAAYCNDHMKEDFCLIPWLMNGVNQIKVVTLLFLILTSLNPVIYRNSSMDVDETTKRIGFTLFLQWMCFLTALPLTFVSFVIYQGFLLPHEKNYSASENASNWISFIIMTIFGLFGSYETNFVTIMFICVMTLTIHFIFVMFLESQGLKVYPALSDDAELAKISGQLTVLVTLISCLLWELVTLIKDRGFGLHANIWKVGTRLGGFGDVEVLTAGRDGVRV